MNRKVYRNQAKLMQASNRKRMYKKGKQWIVASSFFLSLLAGGSLVGVHADNVQPQAKTTTQVSNMNKNKVNSNSQQKAPIQNRMQNQNMKPQQRVSTQANNLHKQLFNNFNNTYNRGLAKLNALKQGTNKQVNNLGQQHHNHPLNLTKSHSMSKVRGLGSSNQVTDGVAFVDKPKAKTQSNTNDMVNEPFYETGMNGSTFNSDQLSNLLPNGYQFAGKNSFKFGTFNSSDDSSNHVHLIPIQSTASSDINLQEDPVDLIGTVYLDVPNHVRISLPYSFQATTNQTVNILNHTTPKASNGAPSGYDSLVNKYFDDSKNGYSFDGNISRTDYNYTINPNTITSFQNGTRLVNKDIVLHFNQNDNRTETIDYVYDGNQVGSDIENGKQGTIHFAGTHIENSNKSGLNAGYYIPKNSFFTFNDGETVHVNVLPNPAYATIQFVDDNGQPIKNSIKNMSYYGNDYRSSKYASNTSMPVSHINPHDIPTGYHIDPSILNNSIKFNNDSNYNSINQFNGKGSTNNITPIHLIPNVESDEVVYENDDGQILKEFRSNGTTPTNSASTTDSLVINSSTASNDHFPTGYVLSSGESSAFNYDGSTHVIKLSGSSVKDNYTIDIVADGNKLTSDTRRGTLTSVGDSVTINPVNYAPATNYLPTDSDQLTTVYVNSDGHLSNTGNGNLLGATGNTITLNYKELKGINGKNGTNGKNGANGATGAAGKNGINGKNGQNGSFSLPNIITVNYKNQLGQVVKTGYVTNASGVHSDLIGDVNVPSDYQIDTREPIYNYNQRTNTTSQMSLTNNTQLFFTADKDPHEITIHVSGLTGSQINDNANSNASASESSATNSANVVINGLSSAVASAQSALSAEVKKDATSGIAAINSNDSKYQSLANELSSLQSAQQSNNSVASSLNNSLKAQAKADNNNSASESKDSTYQSLANELQSLKNSEASNNTSAANANAELSSEVNNSSAYQSLSNELSSLKTAQASSNASASSVSNELSSEAKHDSNNSSTESADSTYTSLSGKLNSLENDESSNASSASSANSKMYSYVDNNIPANQSLTSELNSLKAAQASNSTSTTSVSNALNKEANKDNNSSSIENIDSNFASLSNELQSLEAAKTADSSAVSSASSVMSSEVNNDSAYQSLSNELTSLQSAQASNNASASSVSNALNNQAKHDNNNSTTESNDNNYTSLFNELQSLKADQSSNASAASLANSRMNSVIGNDISNSSAYQSLFNELSSLKAAQSSNSTSTSSVSSALSSEANKDSNNSATESADSNYTSLSSELQSLESAKASNSDATSSADSAMNSVEDGKDSAYQSLANALSSLENRFGYNDSTIASASSVSASASETIHGLESAAKTASSIASSAEFEAKRDHGSAKSNDESTASSASSTDVVDINLINKLNSIITSASNEASSDASNMASASKSVAADSQAVSNDVSKAKKDSNNSVAESNDQKILSSANSILASEEAVSGSASSDDSYADSIINSANNLIRGASNVASSLASEYSTASNAKNQSEMNIFSSEMKSAENAINAANAAAANASNIASSAENALSGLTSASSSATSAASSASAALSSATIAFGSAKNAKASANPSNKAVFSSANTAYSSASRAQSSAASADSSANNAVTSATSASNAEISASNSNKASKEASQKNSQLAANDSSADSASTSASAALSSANFNSNSASDALSSANSASTSTSNELLSANSASLSASNALSSATQSLSTATTSSAKALAGYAQSSAIVASNSTSSIQVSATKDSNSASVAKSIATIASSSASTAVSAATSNSIATSETASSADSLAANTLMRFDPYTYITIIEQEDGKPVKSYAKLIREDNVQMGGTFIIRPSDANIQPAGFTPDNSNQDIVGTMTGTGISLLPGTDTFVYDTDNAKTNNAVQNGIHVIPLVDQYGDSLPADRTPRAYVGAKNEPLSNNQVPSGYQLDPSQDYHFDSKGNLVHKVTNSKGQIIYSDVSKSKDPQINIIGDRVNGKANITLNYIVKGPNGNTITQKADDAQIVINGRVGDHLHFSPWKYFKDNYEIPNNEAEDIVIPQSAVSEQYDYGQQYDPSWTFNYYAQKSAPISIVYRNADNGKEITTDYIDNIRGIAGETVYLDAKGTVNDEPNHYSDLHIPKGYYLPGNSVRVVLTPEISNGLGKTPLLLTVNLHLGNVNEQQAIDTINFNGDPIANTDEVGSLGETGSIEAPVGYHFINGENGTFTFDNQTHNFDVEPNDPTNTNNNVVNFNIPRGASLKPYINEINNPKALNGLIHGNTPTGNGQSVMNNIHMPKSTHKNVNNTVTHLAKDLKPGQSIRIHMRHQRVTIKNKKLHSHFKWVYIVRPIYLHKDIDAIGSHHDILKTVHPHHKFTARIIRIYKLIGNGKSRIRYEVSVKVGKYYRHVFITGDHRYVRNAYYQLRDLHKMRKHHHRYYRAKTIAHVFEYKGRIYSRRSRKHLLKPGRTLHISRIVRMGRRKSHQTKFELTNGRYITANKNYIKLI